MSPEDWSNARIDDLAQKVRDLASLGQLNAKEIAAMDARMMATADAIAAVNKRHEQDMAQVERVRDMNVARFERLFERWSVECNEKIQRIEDRLEEDRASQQWTLSAKLTLFAAVFGPLLGALLIVLSGGH